MSRHHHPDGVEREIQSASYTDSRCLEAEIYSDIPTRGSPKISLLWCGQDSIFGELPDISLIGITMDFSSKTKEYFAG